MLIRFLTYGLLGWGMEIIWTATREKIKGMQTGLVACTGTTAGATMISRRRILTPRAN